MTIDRPVHRVSLVLPIALAALVSLIAMGDGSAGQIWVYSGQADRVSMASERDLASGWLSRLGRAAHQIRGQGACLAMPRAGLPLWGSIADRAVYPCPIIFPQTARPVLPQLTDLPPPSA